MKKLNKTKIEAAFTLIEVLLIVVIIGVLAAASIPVQMSFQARNDIEVATNIAVQTLRRAQVLSQASVGDSAWGVYIQDDNLTLFQGLTYSTRDSSLDEIYGISKSVSVFGGSKEIVFNKFSGTLSTSNNITLDSSISSSKTITVNEKGMVNY